MPALQFITFKSNLTEDHEFRISVGTKKKITFAEIGVFIANSFHESIFTPPPPSANRILVTKNLYIDDGRVQLSKADTTELPTTRNFFAELEWIRDGEWPSTVEDLIKSITDEKNAILGRAKHDRQDLGTIEEARMIAGHTHSMIDHYMDEVARKLHTKKKPLKPASNAIKKRKV